MRVAGGTERIFVNGVTPEYRSLMNRPIGIGRGLTEDDQRRRSTVAVVGATLGSKLFGGADPVGRDIVGRGRAASASSACQASGQIFNEELWQDANGILIPLETYMDRIDPDHKLAHVAVKLASDAGPRRGLGDRCSAAPSRPTTASRTSRSRDLDAEAARG